MKQNQERFGLKILKLLTKKKLNKILDFDQDNLTITVEPGVVTSEINKAAIDHGLLYAGNHLKSCGVKAMNKLLAYAQRQLQLDQLLQDRLLSHGPF